MSFQAYLDAIEAKTGRTPRQLLDEAIARGYQQPGVKAGVIVQWLADEYGLGRGHAMAMVHVITKGPQISSKHVRARRARSPAARAGRRASRPRTASNARRRPRSPAGRA